MNVKKKETNAVITISYHQIISKLLLNKKNKFSIHQFKEAIKFCGKFDDQTGKTIDKRYKQNQYARLDRETRKDIVRTSLKKVGHKFNDQTKGKAINKNHKQNMQALIMKQGT